MDKTKVENSLKRLSNDDSKRTQSAIIRDLMPSITAAKHAGISHKEIHQALVQLGLKLNYESYKTTIYRIAKTKRAAAAGETRRRVKLGTKEESDDVARQYMSREPKNPILEMIEKEKTK